MTLFWLVGAALAAIAVFLLVRPLLKVSGTEPISRRDANISIHRDQLRELDADLRAGLLAQADYERARRELEARALEDAGAGAPERRPPARGRAAAWAVGAGLPLLAAALYLVVGNPGALLPQSDPHAITVQQLDAMVERLASRLRDSPGDVEGWKLLGRSYSALGRFPESADAYAKAAALDPRDAQLLADLADVLAMARGQRLEGEPEKLIARALELDPTNLKALALAGTAAYARKDYATAAAQWEKMLPLVPPDSEDARTIRAYVHEARALAGLAGIPQDKQEAKRTVKGTVSIDAKVKSSASPDDTVFIFARAVEGPPMPLAVQRVKVRELPVSFALDDSMAMAPGMSLSAHPRVVVVARVSRTGSPAAQPGDLQGASAPVANDASGVAVVIDSVVR
jgi:cytochrome c-type biogenesis protein CcmH